VKGILISGIHHWGFSIRVPRVSAGGESYIVPPITTILGALSRGYCVDYAVKDNVSCTQTFINKHIRDIFWVTYGTEEPSLMPYSDLLREERVPYKQQKYRTIEESSQWFGVSAFGKVYGANSVFKIAILLNTENVEFWSKLGWQITSLGSKESLVSITDVKVVDVSEANEEEFSTIFYAPDECISKKEEFEAISMPVKNVYTLSSKPTLGVFSKFLVPKGRPPLIGGKVKLRRNNVNKDTCIVLKILNNYVITFKEGLKRWY